MIADQFREEFPSQVRLRGEDYFRRGRVNLLQATVAGAAARVEGTQPYDVTVQVEGDELGSSCSCAYFVSDGPCKHVWATLRAMDHALVRAQRRGDAKGAAPARPPALPSPPGKPVPAPTVASLMAPPLAPWRFVLDRVRREMISRPTDRPSLLNPRPIGYLIDPELSRPSGGFRIQLFERGVKKDGTLTKVKPIRMTVRDLVHWPEALDRRLIALLRGAGALAGDGDSFGSVYSFPHSPVPSAFTVPPSLLESVMPLLAESGRFYIRRNRFQDEPVRATVDDGPPWQLVVVTARKAGGGMEVTGRLERDEPGTGKVQLDIGVPLLLLEAGWVLFEDRVARFNHAGAYSLAQALRQEGRLAVPAEQEDMMLESLLSLPRLPRVDLPPSLALREEALVPQPALFITPRDASFNRGAPDRFEGQLAFHYGSKQIPEDEPGGAIPDLREGRLLRRDLVAETAARVQLVEAGFRMVPQWDAQLAQTRDGWEVPRPRLAEAVRTLVGLGWQVQAEGRAYRRPGVLKMGIESGMDWFDLTGGADFDGQLVPLPELLRAIRRGEGLVELGDGTLGLLPEDWLARYSSLARFGKADDGVIRFGRNQLGLLDALLTAEPDLAVDDQFAKARGELRGFEGIDPLPAPVGFAGTLRPYQEKGLGWFEFLARFGFGGCLADDMGLGKTVQVLALLLRRQAASKGSTLVVMPRSLLWNWSEESARFAPHLKTWVHHGPERVTSPQALAAMGIDVVFTTYGTVRNDIGWLRQVGFDYVILDESQAIKNADSESAKAVRLLRGDHRLALSGTPIENHVGELWSLFEFLNPGMLGTSSAFAAVSPSGRTDKEGLALFSRALRPFILRRTKEAVAPELPPKHQETLVCEMDPLQRRLYDELRDHYRQKLLGKVAQQGLARSKIHVLEALLRLRQVACHPGLVDKARLEGPSAKLELLLPRLEEVRAEGHKALIFSQFTSFLDIVGKRLDQADVVYERLDGKTRDRAERITHFQEDPACSLFLISLKAGGVGLNLTAADYVFILDPWWNPAVEAQAVDRTHRIGQERKVFVYRLLCRNTVEEKVAALQESKRGLADAVITADNSLIRDLDRETLELLLS